MAIYISVTSEQWKDLNKESKPRYMNKREEDNLNKVYEKLFNSFK